MKKLTKLAPVLAIGLILLLSSIVFYQRTQQKNQYAFRTLYIDIYPYKYSPKLSTIEAYWFNGRFDKIIKSTVEVAGEDCQHHINLIKKRTRAI